MLQAVDILPTPAPPPRRVVASDQADAPLPTAAPRLADPPVRSTPVELDGIVRRTRRRHRIRIHKWRRSMSGCAWRVNYADGSSVNWIEAPRPRSPLSLAIFLHEVGHHVIGFNRFKRRCEEEYHVWKWALAEMQRLGVPPDDEVIERFDLSMRYAVAKAQRRGVKDLPQSLQPFAAPAA